MDEGIRLPGRFNDGSRAVSTDVTVSATETGDRAVIRAADGRTLAEWPRRDVRLVERPAAGAPFRFQCGASDARLTVAAGVARADLLQLFPDMARRDGRRHGVRIAALTVAAAAAVILVATLLLPEIAAGLARLVPGAAAERLGAGTATQLARLIAPKEREEAPFCEGTAGRAALDDLTERLTANLAVPYPVRVRVLASPINNAVALPGGHILMFEGLLRRMDDPSGFAGVLAHEIGHVAERHPLAAAIEGAGVALLVGVVVGDITGGGVVGAVGQAMMGAAYHRDAEAAADGIAVRLLNQAGIRGAGLAAFLDQAAAMEPSDSVAYSIFTTHPASRERAEAVRGATTGAGPGLTPAAWQALRKICENG
jgi:beta-barrel assembly-enhancing protease